MKSLITIIIILILLIPLAGIIVPRFFGCKSMTRWDDALPKMVPIETAIDAYKLNTGKLPTKLADLVTCPAGLKNLWKGPYLKEIQLYDPWDRPYYYNVTNNGYELLSYGADGISGGEGYGTDIYNVDRK